MQRLLQCVYGRFRRLSLNQPTMPTLRQLNIHPQTQKRLSEGGGGGIKRKRSISELNEPNETVTSTQPRPPSFIATAKSSSSSASLSSSSSSFAPIRTPSALLSRDPTQLSSALWTSIQDIKNIRSHVSTGIISDPYVARWIC